MVCLFAGVMICMFSLFEIKQWVSETEDVLMRLIHSGCGYLIQCHLLFAGYGMSESPALFQLLYRMPRTWQQAPAGKRNHLWWNGAPCRSQIWLTGRHGATILPVAPTPVGPSPFLWSSPGLTSLCFIRAHTGNPFPAMGSFTLWVLDKQPLEQQWKERYQKKRQMQIAFFFCPNKECEFILKI